MTDKVKMAAVAVGLTAGLAVSVVGAPLWAAIAAGVGGALLTKKAIDRSA